MFHPSKARRNEGLLVIAATILLALALSAPAAHAQPTCFGNCVTTGLYTQYTSVIEYVTTSGYTFNNVNVTWTNTDDCGSFTFQGAGATWNYGPGVGAIPCTGTLPSGTITQTASSDGTVLATCTDTQGAATYGSISVSSAPSVPSECTTTGAGVSINSFFAQAYDASGNPIAAFSGVNYDWIIAVVVIIILLFLILFMWRKRNKKGPVAAVQTTSASPGIPPASAARFCSSCGSPVEPGASFCPKCGKAL
jgi:hypothetical protein